MGCELDIIRLGKVELVVRFIEIGWIEIKERRWPVVFSDHVLIRQALKLHMQQAFVCARNQLWQLLRIVIGSILNRDAKIASSHQSAITVFLQEKETCRALDIG